MSLIIPLTPKEEATLSVAAKKRGLAPAEFVKKVVAETLSLEHSDINDILDAKLREAQEQDKTVLMPEVSSETLFARWAAEDEQMTDDERAAEAELWKEIEASLLADAPVLRLWLT